MLIYIRYFLSHLCMPFLIIALTFTSVVWLTRALQFIDLIVNKGLDISTFLYISTLLLPSLFMLILPVALSCAVIFIYNKLINDSEILVFESTGLSKLSLAFPALMLAFFVMLINYAISFYILPVSYTEFKDTQTFIRDHYASVLLEEGIFNSPAKGLTVYIEDRERKGLLKGILVHDNRNPEKPETALAEEGKLIRNERGTWFDLIKGSRQQRDVKTGRVTFLNFDFYPLDISVYTQKSGVRHRETEERFLPELLWPENVSDRIKAKLIAEGHHRIVWPFLTLTLVFIAVAGLLSGQFNRRGQWKRIVVIGSTIIFIVIIDIALKSSLPKKPQFIPLLYANAVLPCILGTFMLMRSNNKIKKQPPTAKVNSLV